MEITAHLITDITPALRDVVAERQRQVEVEGWTPEHDDQHATGELALAAACYAYPFPFADPAERLTSDGQRVPQLWPWDDEWWKPSTRNGAAPNERRDMVKAAALLLAEIERLDRLTALSTPPAATGDADGGGDGDDDHPDVTAQRAIEGEPEPDTETMQSYSAHDAEFPAPVSVSRVTPNAEA